MLLTVALFGLAWCVNGKAKQSDRGVRKAVSGQTNFALLIPDTLHKSVGYSQLATVTGGTLVFISGQVALDKSGNVAGRDDFRAQVQQVFENLKKAIAAAGGTFDDVIIAWLNSVRFATST